MSNITLSIPDELKEEMQNLEIINWSAVAREAFSQKISDIKFLKEFRSKSGLTDDDALRLGRKVNEKLSKRYVEE